MIGYANHYNTPGKRCEHAILPPLQKRVAKYDIRSTSYALLGEAFARTPLRNQKRTAGVSTGCADSYEKTEETPASSFTKRRLPSRSPL